MHSYIVNVKNNASHMLGDIKEIKKNSEFIYLYNFGQLNLIEC